MEEVLSGMNESTTFKPDVWTVNTILSLFGNNGQIEMMERWYEKFRGFGIEPETRTFNSLIGAYGKKWMYDKMSSVMEYMRNLSFPWMISTYNNVIEAFADVGDANTWSGEQCPIGWGRLETHENTFFFFYNAVISAYAKAEDFIEMDGVFKCMKDKHCPPDSTTYFIMVEAYRKEGMTDKIYDLEQEEQKMVANGLEVSQLRQAKENFENAVYCRGWYSPSSQWSL
ncbi:hypothetical protein HHK36_026359 [Tetracentron sinense]|uniref:Pentatricopeptide repeat-containing protein n=1 Tax=Tetracentron sinense TaxID=13715 RepID=A0A834YJH5_TETSI|nr:hypothetical protein HHK36_026359 [Tetracentron sinense]